MRQSILFRAKGPGTSARYRCVYGPYAQPPRQRKPAHAWIHSKGAGPRWSRSVFEQLCATRSDCGSTPVNGSERSVWLQTCPREVSLEADVRSQYRASRVDSPHTSRKRSPAALSRCTSQTSLGVLPFLDSQLKLDALGSILGPASKTVGAHPRDLCGRVGCTPSDSCFRRCR